MIKDENLVFFQKISKNGGKESGKRRKINALVNVLNELELMMLITTGTGLD